MLHFSLPLPHADDHGLEDGVKLLDLGIGEGFLAKGARSISFTPLQDTVTMEVMTMITGKGDDFVAKAEVLDTDGAICASVKD